MLRDALLVAGKDLRIEWRSRVALSQLAPFALLVLVLFGFGLDANRAVLRTAASGLFWIAVLFAAVLAVQRAFTIEAGDGVRDALLLTSLEGPALFLGKALALVVELLVLEVLLTVGILVLYDARLDDPLLYVTSAVVATIGVAAAGTLYGALVAGLRVRDTILPILLLPVLAPVLIGATRAYDDALGSVAVDGWPWVGFLGFFAMIYVVFGFVGFGTVLEDS